MTSQEPVNSFVPPTIYIAGNEIFSDGNWHAPAEGRHEVATFNNNTIYNSPVNFKWQWTDNLKRITTSRGAAITVDADSTVVGVKGPIKVSNLVLGNYIGTAAQVPPTQSLSLDINLIKLLSYCTVYGYWEHKRMVVDIPTTDRLARKEFLALIEHYKDFTLGDKKIDEFYLVRGVGKSKIADLCYFHGVEPGVPSFLWSLNNRDLHIFFSIFYNSATEYVVNEYKVFLEKRMDPELIWPLQLLLAKIGIVARRGRTINEKHRLLVLNKRDVEYITNTLKPTDRYSQFAKAYAKIGGHKTWRREGDIWWDAVKSIEDVGRGKHLIASQPVVCNLVVSTSV